MADESETKDSNSGLTSIVAAAIAVCSLALQAYTLKLQDSRERDRDLVQYQERGMTDAKEPIIGAEKYLGEYFSLRDKIDGRLSAFAVDAKNVTDDDWKAFSALWDAEKQLEAWKAANGALLPTRDLADKVTSITNATSQDAAGVQTLIDWKDTSDPAAKQAALNKANTQYSAATIQKQAFDAAARDYLYPKLPTP